LKNKKSQSLFCIVNKGLNDVKGFPVRGRDERREGVEKGKKTD
jgi:hypothetical protein